MTRLRRASWVVLAGTVVLNTYLSLSGHVALWWANESNPKTSTLPRAVRDVLGVRPKSSEADVHMVLWFVAGFVAVLATRTSRARLTVLGALVAYGGLLEVAQHWTKTRTPQWSDFLADAVGISSPGPWRICCCGSPAGETPACSDRAAGNACGNSVWCG